MQEIRPGETTSGTAQLTLNQCRRFYAEEIRAVAGLDSPELVAALASVPRERFLGPPPWRFGSGTSLHPAAYRSTSDPRVSTTMSLWRSRAPARSTTASPA